MTIREPRVMIGVIVTLILLVGGGLWLARRDQQSADASSGALDDDGSSSFGAPDPSIAYDTKQPLEVAQQAPRAPSLIVDVLNPAALRTALLENDWLASANATPLGRGFLGSWSAFLGSARGDVGLGGAGLVRDAIIDVFAAAPLRVVLFEGETPMPPALVTDSSSTTSTALRALTTVLQRGGFTVETCPGEAVDAADVPGAQGVDAGVAPAVSAKQRIDIVRWSVAEHDLYLADTRGRIVVARSPRSVVNGACTTLPAVSGAPGVDVQLRLQVAGLGRPADVLSRLLGLGGDVALSWKIEGARLVPLGIGADVQHPERLDTAPIPPSLLAAVPADTAVALAASVRLPAKLDADSLAAAWSSDQGAAGTLKTRNVLALWQPRGDAKAPTEVALLWSDAADLAALRALFSGKNVMSVDELCGVVVLSSTSALRARIKAACQGSAPSLAFAEPSVVAGLKEPQSLSVLVDVGAVLTNLLDDGWRVERAAAGAAARDRDKPLPKEIEQARVLLEQLPRQGLSGTKNGTALTPRGFSS